jgi:hypothetical protein
VRDFASHQELQCVYGSAAITKVDQSLINYLCKGARSNVTAQIQSKSPVTFR